MALGSANFVNTGAPACGPYLRIGAQQAHDLEDIQSRDLQTARLGRPAENTAGYCTDTERLATHG